MKLENNNKEVVKRLTNRSLKTNKVRNIFAVLAIVLTTFMISSVFTIGISFIKNYKTMNLRVQGTTASVSLEVPSEKQIEKIKSLDIISSLGSEITVGQVELEKLEKNRCAILIRYMDKENFEKQITPAISDIVGTYPEKLDEIMISRRALEFLGKSNAEIGDEIKLPYIINGAVQEKEFKLSGIYTDYGIVQDIGNILISHKFIEANKLSVEQNGKLLMTLKSSARYTAQDILEKEVNLKDNQKFSYSYDRNETLVKTALATAALVVMIALFIVLSGYLLIYNVLYIAVINDINFYGLLKTIGTSPRQIKKMVRNQALKLSIVGIPIGLILSATVSFVIVPLAMSTFFSGTSATAMPREISFNPLIFIGATIFSILTVLLSCNKPAKIAGNISPTEALRYTGAKAKKEKKNRNSTKGGKLYKMAWYNVFREKKRAVLVFLSLFMGVITFLSVNTFLSSINVDNYIERYVKNDFTLQNILDENRDLQDNLDEDLVNSVKSIEGVTRINLVKSSKLQIEMNEKVFLPSLLNQYKNLEGSTEGAYKFLEYIKKSPKDLFTSVVGVDDDLIERVNGELKEKIDVEAFKNGELILLNAWYYGEDYEDINEELTIENSDGKGNKSFKTKIFNDTSGRLPHGLGSPLGISTIYMSNSALESLDSETKNLNVYVDCEEKYEPKVNSELKNIANNRGLWLQSKTGDTEEFNKSQKVMNILGGGVSIILILIGILNFINVMITGVNIRLKEFAVMESIGMTKKQIKRLLSFEGMYYAGITSILICTVGVAIVYLVAEMTKKIVDYAQFIFPIVPLVILITIIFTVCLIVPRVVFKIASKKSVTERIRKIEN